MVWWAVVLLQAGSVATVKVNDRVEHYPVQGNTAVQLHRQMKERAPPDAAGVRYPGQTRWNVGWNYRFDERAGLCRVSSARVTLDVTITLPSWQAPDDVPPSLRQDWETFLVRLNEHEQGHREFGVRAADAVRDAIATLPPQRGCKALETELDRRAQGALDAMAGQELEYDERTSHGLTQGAVFPSADDHEEVSS